MGPGSPGKGWEALPASVWWSKEVQALFCFDVNRGREGKNRFEEIGACFFVADPRFFLAVCGSPGKDVDRVRFTGEGPFQDVCNLAWFV